MAIVILEIVDRPMVELVPSSSALPGVERVELFGKRNVFHVIDRTQFDLIKLITTVVNLIVKIEII